MRFEEQIQTWVEEVNTRPIVQHFVLQAGTEPYLFEVVSSLGYALPPFWR